MCTPYCTVYTEMAQPQRREPLSRERILAAALGLARRDGPEAISMRRIAQELDVWPMSLYRHFRDKEELLDALAGEAAGGIATPHGGSWRDDITELLTAARVAFAAHPAGVRLHREPSLRASGIEILGRAGLDSDDAAIAWTVLVSYAAGSAAVEASLTDFVFGLSLLLDGLAARARV